MILKIAREFSTAPGPRRIVEGNFSGELFRLNFLLPRLRTAIANGEKLIVDLDGSSGYGTSFLEESFGGLIRVDEFRLEQLDKVLSCVSNEEPSLLDEIREYMKDASAASGS